MIRQLVHDPLLLGIKSRTAHKTDISIAQDLMDTLVAHYDTCVGIAANMIGESVRAIAFNDNGTYTLMYNPEIIGRSSPYETEEGCLSLIGAPRKVLRYKTIKVKYQNSNFQWRTETYSGFSAQVIQHETDHCNGVLI